MSHIDIWQGNDELWRWEFHDRRADQDDIALMSNETYLSEEEAEQAARRAYPNATIEFPASFAFKTIKRSRRPDAKSAGGIFGVLALFLVWRAWRARRGRG